MYYQCIRACPLLWIVLTFGACFGLFGYALYEHELPSFDDPLVGFEVRDSDLSTRLNTWRLLIESTSWNGLLSLYPRPYSTESSSTTEKTTEPSSSTVAAAAAAPSPPPKEKKARVRSGGKHRNGTRNRARTETVDHSHSTQQAKYDPFQSKSHQLDQESSGSFFCGKLLEDYVHFVVEPEEKGTNLLQLEPLKSICQLDKVVLRMKEDLPEYDNVSNASNTNTNPNTNTTSTNNNATTSTSNFKHFCEVKNLDQCCPSWSLPNFVLVHANKTDCDSLEEADIDAFVELLRSCSAFFADNYLNEDCASERGQCPNVPEHCYSHNNLVFNVFNYLVDYRFLGMHDQIINRNDSIVLLIESVNQSDPITRPFLTSSSIFLPMAKSSKLMDYYRAVSHSRLFFNLSSTTATTDLAYGAVRVVAADLGLKHALFSESLISDLVLIIIASLIIFGSLLLYTRSILLTATAMATNMASLASAYFIYTTMLDIKFFPFLNLLSVIILIGIGSDNALIYCKAWCCVVSSTSHIAAYKSSNSSHRRHHHHNHHDYHQQMSDALRHVLISTLCASLTTCCAFFAGYFSEITSLKCFSIFAGTSIITNFVITIITFPSAILLSEQLSACWPSSWPLFGQSNSNNNNKLYNRIESCLSTGLSQLVFNQVILKLVFNYRHAISVCFTAIALGSGFLVFCRPGLQLPTSQEFQVFSSRHLFERYDLKYKNEFWYSRFGGRAPPVDPSASPSAVAFTNQMSSVVFPIRVVFGILPVDNGDYLNPFNRGSLVFDPAFNISSPESQIWMLEFCRDLRTQPFYRPSFGPKLTNCFMETFRDWMKDRRCTDQIGNQTVDRFPCCEQTKFPYDPQVFSRCLVQVVELLHRTPQYMFSMNRAGPRFNSSEVGSVKAVVIEYDSVYDAFATSYGDMDKLWHTLDGWVSEQLKTAPVGLRSGWFVTYNTEFYALQQSLSSGVVRSLLIAVAFAFCTLICTTWNIRLSILSTVSIAFLIFTTIGALILLDWRLNVIESITISLTIGLAIDATLHYTIAYKIRAIDFWAFR